MGQFADHRFIGLLEAVPDAIVCVDADGRIAVINDEAERLFGYARDDLIGPGSPARDSPSRAR